MPECACLRPRPRGPDPTKHARAYDARPRARRRVRRRGRSDRGRVSPTDVGHPLVDLGTPAGRDVVAGTGTSGVACDGVDAAEDGAADVLAYAVDYLDCTSGSWGGWSVDVGVEDMAIGRGGRYGYRGYRDVLLT